MIEYERGEINEKELEDAIRQAPHLIEEGLRYITHQRKTKQGRLDVLLIDNANTLVVAELKTVEDDQMLIQALDYYDFVYENLERFADTYKEFNINTERMPRLMMIAPSFSSRLVNNCKWVREDVPITLVSYQPIILKLKETKKRTIIFTTTELVPEVERAEPTPRDEQLNWIRDPEVRELSKRFLDDVKNLDPQNISLDDLRWAVSIKARGQVCAYWEPRQKHVRVCTWDENEEWRGFNFRSQQDYEKYLNLVKSNYKKIMSGKL